MTDMYDRFGESADLEDNDEDIGALGSILSWDDEDEAGVEAAMAATSIALDDREKGIKIPTTLSFKGGASVFMHQFSGISDGGDSGSSFAIPMPTPVNFATDQTPPPPSAQQPKAQSADQNTVQQVFTAAPGTQQQQQAKAQVMQPPAPATQTVQPAPTPTPTPTQSVPTQQQPQPTQSVPSQQPQQPTPAAPAPAPTPNVATTTTAVQQQPVQNQQQQQTGNLQASSQFATPATLMPIPGFSMFQPPSMFAPPNSQQAMQFGMAQMMQQQAQATAQQQATTSQAAQPAQPQAATQTPAQVQQNAFNKVFFQQAWQQAAAQAQQQAAQQFSMQQSRQMAAMNGLAPQPMQTMSAGILPQPLQPTAVAPQPKKPAKRKAPSTSQTTANKRRLNVVSCSDTDGETSGRNTTSTEAKKKTPDGITTSAKVDTSDMNPEERAKAHRDRNREHARNTRLRKKAYLEKLKSTVDELCRERDTLVSERAGAATLLVEMHNTRTEVLMSFFALRSANEQRRELWASILDESCFSCVLPVTPYRSFPASEVQVSKCQRTIMGIDGMMADTASLHVLLNTLIDRSRFPLAKIEFRYTLVTEEVVVAGNQMMARWAMSTVNAVQHGARMEVSKQGMLCAKFNSAHKIIGLELMFDVMAFMLQLKQATGSEAFAVVPNTVQTCQRSFDKPMVMTLAERPYTIVQVNKLWEDMTGYKAEDVVGKASCSVLQGPETNRKTLDSLMTSVRYKRAASGFLVNYTRTGKRFRNHLALYPLSTDSKITHYVALSTHMEEIGDAEPGVPNASCVPATAEAGQPGTKIQPLEGQAQFMSQSMLLPGARTTATLAPLGSSLMQNGAPTMPHPPLGFFAPQVALPTSTMPTMAKIIPSIATTEHNRPASVTSASSGEAPSGSVAI